ncbi:C40 family peptidase [Streptomyces mobaraensis NBRC 13819 = DSM 40847]|uniref:NlpC/P60 family protein n=2 Tax=Streptomyces mobaraensis TaxID=35621 RepID=A0A5N5W342_STRMB|nr:C40 family peptidase [Streptomyces mobaraensis]EMF01115.1 NLP/P60-family protein [Streptomyces mobaraensis NBRC 13819 = DSM 40847]KAB7837195.1 NlpC/P60 family protein [Streptomyces mobaraensis]QTT74427.1 C40 family peptidase [Streptomyces mobaraensis NBRC 13819 = DSM 40847]
MSPNAHITSHRKPRRPATQSWAIRSGVAGGVLSTLAVTGAAQATAAEKPAEATIEMPAINAALSASVAESAAATQQTANDYQVRAQVDKAVDHARVAAKKAKQEADRKAEAERKAAEAKEKREAEQARASRDAQRTALGTKATASADSDDEGTGTGAKGSGTGTTTTSTKSTGATGNAATLISFLRAQVGKAYVMGSTGPSSYDCSGLVMAAYQQIGISLPRVSQDQSTAGTQVSLSNLQPGDILYWGPAGSAYHVGVYIGGGKFIGAQNPSTGIVERDMSYSPPTGAVRVM